MPYNGPAFQNMISHNTPDEARVQLARNLRVFSAKEDDCWIVDMQETYSYEKLQGFNCRYRLNFNSYIGWKVYMLCTGQLASDMGYERKLKEAALATAV